MTDTRGRGDKGLHDSSVSTRFIVVIPIIIAVAVVGAAGAVVITTANEAEWKKKGLSRCPTREECNTATKLLTRAIHYAEKRGRKLSEKVKQKLRELIATGKIALSDAPWLRSEFPDLLSKLSLRDIKAVCRDAYGGYR